MFFFFFFFFKQKTAYEMRISDWSSDVCSSDLDHFLGLGDLLGRFDRVDPPFEFFQVCHEGPYISSSRPQPGRRKPLSENLGERFERGDKALLGVIAKILGVDRKSTRLNSIH